MNTSPLYFVYPGDLDTPTGGYHYDRRLIDELRRTGLDVVTIPLPGDFPYPADASRAQARQALASLPDQAVVIIDGLALGVLDDEVAREAQRLRLVGLCHHPLALESGIDDGVRRTLLVSERRALASVRAVVVTSDNTRDILAADFDVPVDHIVVALPGTDRMPFAPCDGNPLRLLTVASLTPRKAHDVLIDALAPLQSLPWTARFVGSGDFDRGWAQGLEARVLQHRLSDRIHFAGPVTPLEAEYGNADLFVLPSRFEGYGMVFAEALAAGLPIVAARSGAIPAVVPETAGILVPVDDVQALSDALRRVVTDDKLRRQLQAGARQAAATLPTWRDTGGRVAELVIGVGQS